MALMEDSRSTYRNVTVLVGSDIMTRKSKPDIIANARPAWACEAGFPSGLPFESQTLVSTLATSVGQMSANIRSAASDHLQHDRSAASSIT